MFTVWITDEQCHSDSIMCRCTNHNAADAVAKWVNRSQNRHAVVMASAKEY